MKRNESLTDKEIQKKTIAAAAGPHFIPTLTTNQLAGYCFQQQEPPEETGFFAPGQCPLLNNDGCCRVYANRPFSCRAMLSASRCEKNGEATMDPFVFTVNLAVYQMIEHLDRKGRSGNMLDVLTGGDRNTVANSPLPGFLVPPDERKQFQQLMRELIRFPIGNKRLGDFFPDQIFVR